jgi:hypothetical protein
LTVFFVGDLRLTISVNVSSWAGESTNLSLELLGLQRAATSARADPLAKSSPATAALPASC